MALAASLLALPGLLVQPSLRPSGVVRLQRASAPAMEDEGFEDLVAWTCLPADEARGVMLDDVGMSEEEATAFAKALKEAGVVPIA